MPFICLSRTDIPDGVVNILDLFPNTSLRNLIYDPPGQTRYVNRLQNDDVIIDANGAVVFDAYGLRAWLASRVEPGGDLVAEGTIQSVNIGAGDTVTIGGVVFTAVNGGADPAAQEFNDVADTGTDALTIASLVAAINDAASQALIEAANNDVTVTAVQALVGDDFLTLTASESGFPGDLTLATNNAVTIVLSGDALERATDAWTPALLVAVADALVARVDGGLSLTTAVVNAILAAAGAALGAADTTGTLLELLSIMSGRGFFLPAGSVIDDGDHWTSENDGSFTTAVTIFDPAQITSPAGLVENREVKPIRSTYDGGSLQESLLLGHLATFANGVDLFPSSNVTTGTPASFPTVNNARIVVVYDDNGNVLV